MLRLVLIGFVLRQASGVIYRLTPAEYDKLPKLTAIDEYAACMRARGDAYCFVTAGLHGNRSDPLYDTLLHMKGSSNLTVVLEACLNETLSRQYRLTARVSEALCEEYQEHMRWDAGDFAYSAVVLTLLALNLLGSLYDFFCGHGKDALVGRFLLCFSVRKSWRCLAAPPNPKPMQRRIRFIYCMRTVASFAVILGHSPIPAMFLGNKPQFLEEIYHQAVYHILLNGTLVVQVFFWMSGFLLAYNCLLLEERRPPAWQNFPKGVLLRWLRLTPPYALVMFYVMTWARRVSNGPFYLKIVTSESLDCHRNWWRHLLYIQNFKDHSQCMAHGWYLAAEFQLTVVGLLIFCVLHSARSRKLAAGAVVLLGLLALAAHTVLQDLHPFLIVSPEVVLNFFVSDPTFNNLYKRGQTNLVCYGLGLATAFHVYNLKESDLGAARFKKYRWLSWLVVPLMVALMMACGVFYADGLLVPVAVRAVTAGALKLVFGFLTILLALFAILKVDRTGQALVHWGGWAPAARLTFGAYLVHVPVLRLGIGNSDELVPIGVYWIIQNYLSCLVISFLVAVPLFLLVEAPLGALMNMLISGPARTVGASKGNTAPVIAGTGAGKVNTAPVTAGTVTGKVNTAPVTAGTGAGKINTALVTAGTDAGKGNTAPVTAGTGAAKVNTAPVTAGTGAAKVNTALVTAGTGASKETVEARL